MLPLLMSHIFLRNEDAIVFFQHLVIVEIPYYVQGGLESDVTQSYEDNDPVWKEQSTKSYV